MSPGIITLYVFVLAAVVSVMVMLFTRTVFYAALSLIVCLISIAGIYALLYAEFLAITQLIIYAGGVLVLILFGIMLTNRIAGKPLLTEKHHVVKSSIIAIGMFILLIFAYQKTSFSQVNPAPAQGNHINHIGKELMSTYVAPFEIGGILLLVCLIGAALMASSFKKNGNV
jgi:NADH:ubiquinone oxidoreductase subunit 6 (subunit J)